MGRKLKKNQKGNASKEKPKGKETKEIPEMQM